MHGVDVAAVVAVEVDAAAGVVAAIVAAAAAVARGLRWETSAEAVDDPRVAAVSVRRPARNRRIRAETDPRWGTPRAREAVAAGNPIVPRGPRAEEISIRQVADIRM